MCDILEIFASTFLNVGHFLLVSNFLYLFPTPLWPHPPVWKDTSIIHCLCVWLITSLDSSTTAQVTDHLEGSAETHEWDLQDLAALWQTLLQKQKIQTLLRGFQLFLKVTL